jgi:hypothetical protein
MPNGLAYAVRSGDYHFLFELVFERQQGNKIYRYDAISGIERLWYDFDLTAGDTVNSFPYRSDTTDIILLDARVDTIFGLARRTWWFLVDNIRTAIDDEQIVEITDTLGLTDYSEAFGGSTLLGAVLNGVKYGTITTVMPDAPKEPSAFRLGMNYPNPFNPSTTISYRVPEAVHVMLTISDARGRVVARLVDETKPAGEHRAVWEASSFSSGVYFYRITAGAFTETRRMLLIR